jgi:type IV secretory pathway TrbD component
VKPPIGTAIHRALTEPVLILGMERKLALYLLIPVGGVLAGGGLHWYTLGASILWIGVGIWGLRQLGKADPQMERVSLRWWRYQAVYEPEARAGMPSPSFTYRPAVPSSREASW